MSTATDMSIAAKRELYWPQLVGAVKAAGLVIVEEDDDISWMTVRAEGRGLARVDLSDQWSRDAWLRPTGQLGVRVAPAQWSADIRQRTFPEKKSGGFSWDKIVERVLHVIAECERASAERAEGRVRRAAAKQVLSAAASEVGVDAEYVASPTEDGLVRFYEFKCKPEHARDVLEVLKRVGVIQQESTNGR